MSSLLKQLRAEAALISDEDRPSIEVPRGFVAFCTELRVELTPAQRTLALIAYDGVAIADLAPEERAIARLLFGDVEEISRAARAVVVAVCGGRAGKSYALVALRLVHGMYVRDLSTLAPGQPAVALVVAPNEKLRQEVVNYAVGAIRSHPQLRETLIVPKGTTDDDLVSTFAVRRPDGHRVTFEGGVATRGGYGGRGRSLTDFAMDEAAFFRDASYKVNDEEVFKGASPRVLEGGQSIIASTPWGEAGLLYDMWKRNHGKPVDALVAHAPTLLLRPAARPMVDRERARDPDNAEREFDAKFMTGGTTVFFATADIDAAIAKELDLAGTPQPGDVVAAGGDFGFRSDSSALAAVFKRDGLLVLARLLELRPEPDHPLRPGETVSKFAGEMLSAGATYLMADGHYREAIVEHLIAHKLAFVDAPGVPAEAYVRARVLLRDRRVRLPDPERYPEVKRLVQQLREVQGRPLPGGGMSIIQPRWRSGGHGDLASAFVLALHQLGGDEIPRDKPKPGSEAWEDQQRTARRGELRARLDKPWYRGGKRV